MNEPKILYISRKLPPQVGGMEQHSAALLEALQVPVFLIGLRKRQYHLPWWIVYAFFVGLWKARSHDVIFLQDALLTPLGVALKKLTGKPLVITAHGLDIIYPKAFYQRWFMRYLTLADAITCVSNATKIECMKRGVAENKITVIPNGIYPVEKHTSADGRILILGRLVERKGVLWFLQAVLPKLQNTPNVDIVGGGELYDRVVRAAAGYPNVTVHGRISQKEKEALWEKTSVFVMPNIYKGGDMEGFGITAIEAGAYGIPVVAANMQGIADAVINERTGILFPPENTDACASAIQTAAHWSEEKRASVKTTVEALFNWDHIARAYEQIYYSVHSRS